jgi:hypothetical protein
MPTVSKTRKPRKVVRTIRLVTPPTSAMPGVVTIAVNKDRSDYFLTALPSDYGRAFRVEKMGTYPEEGYDVHLSLDGDSCECKGFLRWGHCKHADGLAALVNAGKL